MKEDLTLTEAALLYGCSRSNMFYLINSGRIPFRRNGRQVEISRSDVLALREARDGREQNNQWIEPISRGA